ncbi:J domain-containing protein [Listeria goaensis]|uniref:J domain-containing protein n=1 Tax=Listeria goaensis TaxID=1649188 RepID=UPI000B597F0F|nr:DnaJ domain-containing protein [Listeria goaensis]
MDNYYAELGIETTATVEEIKLAYRSLAKIYHPDRNPGDSRKQERFIRIAKAYEVLKDSKMKADYDVELKQSRAKHYTETMRNTATSYSTSDFEQFFGFTQEGKQLKRQTKSKGNPIDVSEMFEQFLKK